MTRPVVAAVLLAAACRATPKATHTLWVHGQPVAHATLDAHPPAYRWTTDYALEPPRRRVDEVTVDAQGQLQTARHRVWVDGALQREVTLTATGTEVRWHGMHGGTTLSGTWQLPKVPFADVALAALPVGKALAWDGRAIRPVAVEDHPTGKVLVAEDGRLHVDAGTWTFPDGSALRPGMDPLEPGDPVALLRVPAAVDGDLHEHRTATWAWPGREAPITVAVPHPLEVPDTRPGPPPARTHWAVPEPLPSPPQRLAPTRLRRLIDAAFDLAVRAAPAGKPQREQCQTLARVAAGALVAEGVHAEVTRGWVLDTDAAPHFVRHAWVRVWVGGALGWLDVDPALGQRIADPSHLRDDQVGAGVPEGTVRLLRARAKADAPAGPSPTNDVR